MYCCYCTTFEVKYKCEYKQRISHNACINFFQDKIRPTVKILYVSLLFSKYIILKSETSLFQKTILFTAYLSFQFSLAYFHHKVFFSLFDYLQWSLSFVRIVLVFIQRFLGFLKMIKKKRNANLMFLFSRIVTIELLMNTHTFQVKFVKFSDRNLYMWYGYSRCQIFPICYVWLV